MRGRKPVPDHVKAARGRGRSRLGIAAPLPACPDWMPEIARQEWARIAELVPSLTAVDSPLLEAYCTTYARWREVDSQLTDYVKVGKVNPLLRARGQLLSELKRFAIEFGFSPASRGRIELPPEKSAETEAFEEWSNG